MNHKKRGKAVIFCNQNFKKQDGTPLPDAELAGYGMDAHRMVNTLTAMGWDPSDILVEKDLVRSEIKETMAQLKAIDHSDSDCVLVVVLSHGGKNECLSDAESNSYGENELWAPFVGVQSLVGKPKILIKQACRGTRVRELSLCFISK